MAKRSNYQDRVIRNYYQNRESISLQRVQELVTELYLTTGKKREKHWQTLASHLEKLGVKQDTIDHLVTQDDPARVATLIESLMKKS